jgi:hypothetical protein
MITFKPPVGALTAEEFEGRGNHFESDIHIIETLADSASAEWTQHILDKYADDVIAYYIAPAVGNGTFVIQLQFAATPEGRTVATECRREYLSGFRKGGQVPRKKRELNAKTKPGRRKRLFKDRLYRLPDGTFFWYYALWDCHGNVVGKVEVMDQPRQDSVPLTNKILHRSELEAAELIPKGEEPWTL